MKIIPVIDNDLKDLKDQYLWAISRLDAIIAEPAWTNAKVIQAVVDEAKIQRKVLIMMRKIIDKV